MKEIALSPALSKRIKQASVQDADLLVKDRNDSEKHCFHRHSRRVWERLDRNERDVIRKQVIAQNAKNTFLPTDARYEEYECIRMVEAMLGAKKK